MLFVFVNPFHARHVQEHFSGTGCPANALHAKRIGVRRPVSSQVRRALLVPLVKCLLIVVFLPPSVSGTN